MDKEARKLLANIHTCERIVRVQKRNFRIASACLITVASLMILAAGHLLFLGLNWEIVILLIVELVCTAGLGFVWWCWADRAGVTKWENSAPQKLEQAQRAFEEHLLQSDEEKTPAPVVQPVYKPVYPSELMAPTDIIARCDLCADVYYGSDYSAVKKQLVQHIKSYHGIHTQGGW